MWESNGYAQPSPADPITVRLGLDQGYMLATPSPVSAWPAGGIGGSWQYEGEHCHLEELHNPRAIIIQQFSPGSYNNCAVRNTMIVAISFI